MADILLVDDNGSVLLTLAIALRRRGHHVAVAATGTDALAQLESHDFDFLVSDVRMPGMSGIELATHARTMAKPPRVILTSAYSNIESHEGLAEAFLRKPIDTDQLHALLSSSDTPGMIQPPTMREMRRASDAKDAPLHITRLRQNRATA
ncbi:MAG TPA: response regulator [Abditibacteriaceae bacterium]|jgi:two-component system cell cycle response regulator CpdR